MNHNEKEFEVTLMMRKERINLYELMRKEKSELFKTTNISHDRLLTALSSALIGFSLIFTKTWNECHALLYVSWVLLLVALLSSIAVFWLSYLCIKERMENDENIYLKNEDGKKNSPYETRLLITRIILDLGFLLGLIFFLIFAVINI